MSDDLKGYIYNNLDQKETDALVEIWRKNDRVEWSDETFDVLEKILRRRLGDIPEQNEPIFEYPEQLPQVEFDEDVPSEILDDKNAPLFYEPREVLLLSKWLNRMAILNIVMMLILCISASGSVYKYVFSLIPIDDQMKFLVSMISTGIVILVYAVITYIEYLIIKGLSIILKIIMEMEFNSRDVKSDFLKKDDNQV